MTTTHQTPNPMPYVTWMFVSFGIGLAVSIPTQLVYGDSTADTAMIVITCTGLLLSVLAYVVREPGGDER